MTVKAVIFDLDDTLAPEWQFVRSGYQHVARLLSKQLTGTAFNHAFQALKRAFADDPTRVFDIALVDLGAEPTSEFVQTLIRTYRDHKPELHFYPDVVPTLRALREGGIRTGIITDGNAVTQRNKLVALNATQHVDYIIVTDELGKAFWKPHPLAFEMMSQHFNVPLDSLAYVGDNPTKDFVIGATHGVTTFRIIRDRGVHAHLPYAHHVFEDVRIESLADIHPHLSLDDLPEVSHA